MENACGSISITNQWKMLLEIPRPLPLYLFNTSLTRVNRNWFSNSFDQFPGAFSLCFSLSLSLSLYLYFSLFLFLSHSLAVFEKIPTRSWHGKRCNCRFQQGVRGGQAVAKTQTHANFESSETRHMWTFSKPWDRFLYYAAQMFTTPPHGCAVHPNEFCLLSNLRCLRAWCLWLGAWTLARPSTESFTKGARKPPVFVGGCGECTRTKYW